MSTNKWLSYLENLNASFGVSPAASQDREHWRQYAGSVADKLRRGELPPAVSVFGPVLARDEQAFFQGSVSYARMYGGDSTYYTSDLMALGSWKFMAGAYALNGYVNHRRRKAARREATVCWRDHQHAQLIATDRRLMVHVAPHGWQSFDYLAITEYYPNLQESSLTLGFGDSVAPLMLAGNAIPAASVLVSAVAAPHSWDQDPRLAPLLSHR